MAVAENIKAACESFYRSIPPYYIAKRTPLIIGLGHKARRGKDTVAQHLVSVFKSDDLDVKQYGFAQSLKVEVFDWLQTSAFVASEFLCEHSFDQWEFDTGKAFTFEEKLAWVEKYKVDIRPLLQKWGTQLRRTQNAEYWVTQTLGRIHFEAPHVALISDMRFKNEAKVCDVTIRIEREGYKETDPSIGTHISEAELDDYPYDHVIEVRDGDTDELRGKAAELFDKILFERRILIR